MLPEGTAMDQRHARGGAAFSRPDGRGLHAATSMKVVVGKVSGLPQRRPEDHRRQRRVHRDLPRRRPLLRDLFATRCPQTSGGRSALSGTSRRVGGGKRPRRRAPGLRAPADRLPLARLGVRPRHRPVVHGPGRGNMAALSYDVSVLLTSEPRGELDSPRPGGHGTGRAATGRRPHPRPVHRRDDAGIARAGLRARRRLAGPRGNPGSQAAGASAVSGETRGSGGSAAKEARA